MKLKTKISGLLAIGALILTTTLNMTDSLASVALLGDVNQDGVVSIVDATMIQKYLADMITLTTSQKEAADVNRDGVVDLKDVTYIQKYLAGIINEFPDETVTMSSNTWTTISASSYKNFTIKSNYAITYEIDYENGDGWLTVSRTGNVFKVTVRSNPSVYSYKATIIIKANGKEFPITIKQLGDLSSGNNFDGYAACYGYALNLTADPRSNPGQIVSIFTSAKPCKPGALSSLAQYNIYNFDDITYVNYGSNLVTKFEEYTMEYVKADMKALGWNITKVSSATHQVKDGNWLVALTFNPYEVIWASNGGYPKYSMDYHWYRRVDSSNGTSTWYHKRGTTAIQNIGTRVPESDCISLSSYIASQNSGNHTDTNSGSFGYLFVGYYEVGPN